MELHASLGGSPDEEALQLLRQLPQVLLGRPNPRGAEGRWVDLGGEDGGDDGDTGLVTSVGG